MTDFAWTFSEVQDFFVRRFRLPNERRTALRGRLQNLQKSGTPSNINTGRGKPARYGLSQMVELSIAMELMDLGFPPDRTIRIVKTELKQVFDALQLSETEPDDYEICAPKPALLVISASAKDPSAPPRARTAQIFTPNEFSELLLEERLPLSFPIAVIDLQEIVFRLNDWFAEYHPSRAAIRKFVREEGDKNLARTKEGAP